MLSLLLLLHVLRVYSFNMLVVMQAIKKGKLTMEDVTKSVKPLIYTRMRLGDFDPPEMNPYSKIDKSVLLSPAHREMAVQAASMSFVLLKNLKNYLPIRKRFQHLAVSQSMLLVTSCNSAGKCFGVTRSSYFLVLNILQVAIFSARI